MIKLKGYVITETKKRLRLFYDEEAPYKNDELAERNPGEIDWEDGWEQWSFPMGNGFFGANVFGRTKTERVQLTEKTLSNPYYRKIDGHNVSLGGLNNFSEVYIDFGHENVTNYKRELDITNAVAFVEYQHEGVVYKREYFISYPDNVMVIRIIASEKGNIGFTLRTEIPYMQEYAVSPSDGASKLGTVKAYDNGRIVMSGNMGRYNIDFEGQLQIIQQGGEMKSDKDSVSVSGADSACILIAVGTNYELSSNIFTEENDSLKLSQSNSSASDKVSGYMNKALKYSFEELKKRHIEDYSTLFKRVSLDLGEDDEGKTTDVLLDNYKKGKCSKYLEELYFQYGRYLLISSSRKGSLPANLQGTWSRYNFSPWGSGYWHNINVQMNYWPAFNTNLSETFEAYAEFNSAYMPQAKKFAEEIIKEYHSAKYDCDGGDGWCIGVAAFPYEISKSRSAGNVGFTTSLFWDSYEFSQDTELLRNRVYPVMKSAAQYITKIVEPDEHGKYLTVYSDSPEQFVDGSWYHTKGTAYDQSFAYENNLNVKKAVQILGIEKEDIIKTIEAQLDLYDPIHIGYSGQIKEFREEKYYGDLGEDKHRHISQLVGLYPGTIINSSTPAWLDAAIVSLNKRGDMATGWGMAHRLNLWARTKNGERAYSILKRLLKDGTAYNLWDLHPPFQIDGNLGGTAGVAEMLVQSHEGYIDILPALPSEWKDGSFSGICARGGFEISAVWKDSDAVYFNILSKSGTKCSVGYFNISSAKVCDSYGQTVNFKIIEKNRIEFNTEKNGVYIIYDIEKKEYIEAPQELSVEKRNYCHILKWNKSIHAESYNIYIAVENEPGYTMLASVRDNEYKNYYEKNKRITYKVCTVSKNGNESRGSLVYVIPADKEERENKDE